MSDPGALAPPRRWVAVLLYTSSSPRPDYRPLFEESMALFDAADELEAHRKAWAYGATQEQAYDSADGTPVRWRLLEVVEVVEALEDPARDGVEILSRHFRDLGAYRRWRADDEDDAGGRGG